MLTSVGAVIASRTVFLLSSTRRDTAQTNQSVLQETREDVFWRYC